MSLLANNEHLPKVVTQIDGIRDVLDAISPEIDLLNQKIEQSLKELFVETTEEYIANWEKDFNIVFDASLTLDERRLTILNKIRKKANLTWKNLNTLIKSNIEKVPFFIVNNSSEYTFKVVVATPNVEQLYRALNKAKPAYLTFSIEITDIYVRYCRTFNCGESPL